MSTLITPPPVQSDSRPRPSATSTAVTAFRCGLLGLLPGAGLVLGPAALGLGARAVRGPAHPYRGRAVAAIVLGGLALLVQVGVIGAALWWAAGGFDDDPRSKPPDAKPAAAPVETKKVEVGKNVVLEIQGDQRRVLVNAQVCMREGQLEQLLTRKQTKEHEAVLAADVDARHIHAALLLAGAKEGTPVKYQPRYEPATGSAIRVTLQYEQKGKRITVPAWDWVRDVKTRKNLNIDWVFAGSRLVDVPLEPGRKHYLANEGDLICVSNFDTAMLDLPIKSPKDNIDLAFEPHTERIPPLNTKVTVILEVLPEKKP